MLSNEVLKMVSIFIKEEGIYPNELHLGYTELIDELNEFAIRSFLPVKKRDIYEDNKGFCLYMGMRVFTTIYHHNYVRWTLESQKKIKEIKYVRM